MLVLLCLPLFLSFATEAQAQTPSCSASDTAVTAVITDVNDTAGRTALAGDCTALLGLKNTIEGTTGNLNWANSLSMASWDGISVTGSRVTSVNLTNKSLNGTIPATFPSSVTQLHLNENQLTGNVPDLSSLTSLTELFLHQNELDGTITPSHFPSSLVDFQLHENDFSGSIPDLSHLTSLKSLSLAENRMTGTVDDAHVPTTVTVIALQGNQLSGQIPTFAGHSVRNLYLQRNKLTGNIPDLSGTNIIYLTINENRLHGELNVDHLPETLEHLQAQRNRLTGSLPDLSGTKLEILILSDNEFSGTINASHFPTTIDYLYLMRNKLTGNIPSFNGLTNLTRIYLYQNQFTGSLPTTWSAMTRLQRLHLRFNPVTGAIPSGLGDLTGLQQLSLCGTDLDSSATLPPGLEARRTAGTLTVYSCISVDDAAAIEGDSIGFTVNYDIYPMKGSSSVQLNYETEDVTATAGSDDYTGTNSGNVTIPAIGTNDSNARATISVLTTSDSVNEPDETFIVRLVSLPTGMFSRGSATGTIVECSATAAVCSSNIRVLENGGVATYYVRLTRAPSGGDTTVTIGKTGRYPGAANASTTTLTFTASNYQTPQQVTVTGVDDSTSHENRTLSLTHRANGGNYTNWDLGTVTVNVDDAPEVEAWDTAVWEYTVLDKGDLDNPDPSKRRPQTIRVDRDQVQRPSTVKATRGFRYFRQDFAPVTRLFYKLRLSNRPAPGETVTVTAKSSDFAKFGLSRTRYGTPEASLTVTFDDSDADRACYQGSIRFAHDMPSTVSWECYHRIWVINRQSKSDRNAEKGCSDISHTASGGGLRPTYVGSIRAHAVAGAQVQSDAPGRGCDLITGTDEAGDDKNYNPQGSPAQAAPAPTEKISNLQVTAVDATSVSVTWDAAEHATSYDVSWSAESSDSLAASAGALPGVTGTSTTIQHDALVPMTLTVTVTPEYIDENGVTQQLDALASEATLEVGPGVQELGSGGGTNGGDGGSIDAGFGAVDLPVPVSHWRFEDDAVDWVGSSHGTEKGGVAFEANEDGEGVGTHALSLDGTDDYVDLASHVSDFPLGDSTRSVTGWFKADTGNQRQTFFTYGPNVEGKRFSIAADRTQVLVAVSGHAWGVNGLELKDGWHHIAVTYAGGDSDDILIYLDGELQTASTLAGSSKQLDTQTGPAAIGRNIGGTKHYTGLIDDVRLYDVALSAEHVLALFEEHPQTVLVEDNPEACVSDELLADMEGYSKETWRESADHVERWLRVLETFSGTASDSRVMTPTEAEGYVNRGWPRWEPVLEALECMEERDQ